MTNPSYPAGVTESDIDRIGEPLGGRGMSDIERAEKLIVEQQVEIKELQRKLAIAEESLKYALENDSCKCEADITIKQALEQMRGEK